MFLGWWEAARPEVLPSPLDVLYAFPGVWDNGLADALVSSLVVNWESLAVSAAVSLPLAYLCRTPAFKPLSDCVSKVRFVSPAVFYVILLFLANGGHQLKVLLLSLGETVFLVTTMIGVVRSIPNEEFDDARVLRMGEWKATWYVVVRGTLAQAIDAIRDNQAMGWSMLMMVEGIVASEGGVGLMSHYQERVQNFAGIYAIAITVIAAGILQDYLIGVFRKAVCPYANS